MAYRMLSRALSRNSKADEARTNMQIADRQPQYRGWLVFDSRLMDSHALAQSQRYLENQMRLAQGNDVEKFIALGEKLLKRRPGDFNTLGLVAEGYAELDNFHKALEIVDRALELDPDSLKTLCLRSRLLFHSGKTDEAYKILDDVLALDDKYANAYALRGFFLMRDEKKIAEARVALEKCVELDPIAMDARMALVDILLRGNEFAQARKYLRQIQQIDPNNFTANRLLQSLPQN